MDKSLKGKTVVITGASRGIGRGIALAFAAEGANLAIIARSKDGLSEVKRQAEKQGVKVIVSAADVSVEKEVITFADSVRAAFTKADILVNCAGQFLEKDFFKTTSDDWQKIIGSNLAGTFFCAREIGKLMRDGGGGVMINFSSVGGRIGLKNKAVYCASKFGIAGLSKALSKEFKPYKIKVHTIYPYMVDSALKADWSAAENVLNTLKVEDVAQFVVSLAKLPLRVEIEDIYLDTFLK